VVLGICDVLAGHGVRPDVVAGVGRSGMVGAAVAGTVDRRDLFELLARLRDLPEQPATAYHAPMRQYLTELIEPAVAAITFRDPHTPLCGGVAPFLYRTAEQVRAMFLRCHTQPVSIPRLLECLDQYETRLAFLVGASRCDLFPGTRERTVIRIDSPGRLNEALSLFRDDIP
jgi:hypothetical protein